MYCSICKKQIIYKSIKGLSLHLRHSHKDITCEQYYVKFIGKITHCTCGKETTFISLSEGFREFCSVKCSNGDKNKLRRAQKTCMKNYGTTNPSQSEVVRNRIMLTCMKNYGTTNPIYSNEILQKIRKIKENLGYQVPLNNVGEWERYRRKVKAETRKWKKQLFENWNGYCYYTGDKLITDITKRCHKLYRTIDHKISVHFGFKHNIDPEIIGNIENLCICSKSYNSSKH